MSLISKIGVEIIGFRFYNDVLLCNQLYITILGELTHL